MFELSRLSPFRPGGRLTEGGLEAVREEGLAARYGGRLAAAGLVLLCLATFAAVLFIVSTHDALRLNARATRVREDVHLLARSVSEMEAAEAGFVAVGDPAMQQAFDTHQASLLPMISRIETLVQRKEQKERLARIRDVLADLQAQAGEVMRLSASGQTEAARTAYQAQLAGPAQRDMQVLLNELVNRNAEIRSEILHNYRSTSRGEIGALIAVALAIIVFGLHQFSSSQRFVRQLADSRLRLRAANQTLEAQVEGRTSELSRSNQLLAAALTASRITTASQDENLIYTWIENPQLGLLTADAVGRSDLDVLPPGDMRDRLIAAKQRVIAGGTGETLEVVTEHDGQRASYRVWLEPLREGGRTAGVIMVAGDITEDRRARRKLRELSDELAGTVQRFDIALRAANVLVFAQARDRRFTWISREVFGLTPAEIIGKREEEFVPQDARVIAVAAKEGVLTTGQPRDYEYSALVNGERHWYRARAEPVFGPDGAVTGILGAVIDVTSENFAQQRLWSVTDELAATVARFDVALRGADVFVFAQDRDRRLTFVSDRANGLTPLELVGKRDEDVLPPELNAVLVPVKEQVLRAGEPQQLTVPTLAEDGSQRWIKVQIEPQRDPMGNVSGLIGCAVDVTAERLGQQRERHLADELRTTVQRFEVALRGADVTVFTQDENLVYTWVSQNFLNRPAADFVGRSEDEVLPPEMGPKLQAMKRAVLEEGVPQQGEFRFPSRSDERWYFVHAEPQRNETGRIVGLLAAAVDVTERRQRETHIRILLRELTHRTKNLLAVVQAMARQTLTTSTSARDFEARFSGRLQGLASSLDILVNENWEGASIEELVLSQLGHYREFVGRRITLSGPDIRLEPEAAQNIGLALHELGTNSSKYGALSVPLGKVQISWERIRTPQGDGLRFRWCESGGPPVSAPTRKGFGYAVLERLVPRALGGHSELRHDPEGLSWSVEISATHIREPEETPRPAKVWAG